MFIENFNNIFTGLHSWVLQDKLFHYKAVMGSGFQVGETITGSISGATGTVVSNSTNFMRYTKTSSQQFDKGDVVTGGTSGSTCVVKNLNKFHTSVGDRVYFQEAPEQTLTTVLPYALYQFEGATPDLYDRNRMMKIILSWTIYSKTSSSSEIFTILSNLYSIFDSLTPQDITFSGFSFLSLFDMETSRVYRSVDKIWQCTVTYELFVK